MSKISVGEHFRQLRKEKNWPLRKVAALLDIDVAILSKMERGQRPLSNEVIRKLAKIYQVEAQPLIVRFLNEKLIQEYGQDESGREAIIAAEQEIAYGINPGAVLKSYELPLHQIRKFFENQKLVTKAWVIGSMARGDYSASSDVDILIDVPGSIPFNLFDLAEIQYHLEKIAGKKVDIIMWNGISPLMKNYVQKDMKLIYEA